MAMQYYYNKRIQNAPIRRRLDRRFVSWVLVSACIGAVIASGFVFSAKCHFEAVALGYQTQQQRAQLDEQSERRRQLELDRARALAPEELEQRARRVGLRSPELVQPTDSTTTAAISRPAGGQAVAAVAKAPRTEPSDEVDAATVQVSDKAVERQEPAPAPAETERSRKAGRY